MAASRRPAPDRRIDINMTPMIDVVFQLLTFFLMTFRVAAAEGNFDLKLPLDGPSVDIDPRADEIRIHVVAAPNGDLQAIYVGNTPVTGRNAVTLLHDSVVRLFNTARDARREEPSIVLDPDDGLRYEILTQVIAAVSQDADADGNAVSLAKKLKFAPPR